jgi:integrase/recombinase XerD
MNSMNAGDCARELGTLPRLVFATEEFEFAGASYPGFPLLLGPLRWPLEPAHTFLWHTIIDGGIEGKLTWEKYGRMLYDYFAYLAANGLEWDAQLVAGVPSVVQTYKVWSIQECELDKGTTVNQRIRLVVRFYEWAVKVGHIRAVPFLYREVRSNVPGGFLKHVKSNQKTKQATVIGRNAPCARIKFLASGQIQSCRDELPDTSHILLFELMVRAGLRSSEARTFPLAYVVDPKATDYASAAYVPVHLDPRDMEIKGARPRTVHVPRTLMEDLSAYAVYERNRRLARSHDSSTVCILNELGRPFARSSVIDIFVQLSRRVEFYVRAHMLRHTYATFTLYRLRRSKTFKGDPLVYLRNRLGHSDLTTTEDYLHVVEQLEGALLEEHNKELDGLWSDNVVVE